MLQSISWNEFLTTLAILVGSYYLIATLLLYSREITNTLKGVKTPKLAEADTPVALPNDNLMGKARLETASKPTTTTVSTDELFTHPESEMGEPLLPIQHADTIIIGTIADLLQEIKALLEIAEGNSKNEIVPLFQSTLERYKVLGGSTYRSAISLYIFSALQELSIHVPLSEIDAWWADQLTSNEKQ